MRIKRFLLIVLFLSAFFKQARAEETLTWIACVAEAQKNNPDLIYAEKGVTKQEAAKGIAASALYPQVDSELSAARTKTTTTKNSFSYGVSAEQLIFDGLKTINEVRGAKEDIKAAQQNYRFASTDVRFNLRTAFVNLLKAQEMVGVNQEIVKIRRDNLIRVTLRYTSGLEHKGSLLTAEADLAGAEYKLSESKRDLEYIQRQLLKEMGRKDYTPVKAAGDFIVTDTAKEKPDFDRLVKSKPEVLKAAAELNSAAFAISAAYGNYAPKITGSTGIDKTGATWPPEQKGWNLGGSLTLPIFEGGLRAAQVKQAKAIYDQAAANERSVRDAAAVELEKSWALLQDSIESVGVQRKVLDASQERAKISEAQYAIGFITFDNWIIIQDNLVNAKRGYLDVQANALLAEAEWTKAKGEVLEYAQ